MHSDLPAKEDLLQRRPFAQKIARIIASQRNEDPLVISINGPWGDGKSTVFTFLKDELERWTLPTLIFNPWRYPHENDLLRAFFVELAEKLDVHLLGPGEKMAEVAKKHLGWLKGGAEEAVNLYTVPGAGAATGALLGQMGTWFTPALEDLRKRLRDKLDEKKQRIAILLDDPDRLEAEELFALFRLIKLTADFPYTTFVLAMDYDAVAKTVGRRFRSTEEGRKFLEKIVQVPLRLPAVPRLKLAAYAMGLVEDALAGLKIDLPASEWRRFETEFDAFILPRIKTPRLAKRYANILTFTLGLTAGQVNEVDVMIMEAIRLFEGESFHRLMDHLNYKNAPLWSALGSAGFETLLNQALLDVLSPKHVVEADSDLRNILGRLFPSRFPKTQQIDVDLTQMRQQRRVDSSECFIRYAACTLPDYDIPDSDVEGLVDLAASEDAGLVSGRLEVLYSEQTGAVLMQRLLGYVEQLDERQCSMLVSALTDLSRHFGSPSQSSILTGILNQAAQVAKECIAKVSSFEQREALLKETVENAYGWLWGLMVYSRFPPPRLVVRLKSSSDKLGSPFTRSQLDNVGKALADMIMDDLEASPPSSTLGKFKLSQKVLRTCAETQRLHAWTQAQITSDPSMLTHLVRLHLEPWSSDRGSILRWPGDKKLLQHMAAYVDLEWLAQQRLSKPRVIKKSREDEITIEEAVCRLIDLLPKPPPPAPPPENPPDALPG